jgi:hypothetical protein
LSATASSIGKKDEKGKSKKQKAKEEEERRLEEGI